MTNENVKRVIVVCKTHLDIGFTDWQLCKLGQWIDPRQVISGGNRQMHCCEALRCSHPAALITLSSPDAPLISVARRNVYQPDDRMEDPGEGFWLNLYNNRWGTNFKQWFEEDMRFTVTMNFHWNQ